MDSNVTLIFILSLIIVFSPHISNFLRFPTTPIEIVLGSLLAPLGLITADNSVTQDYFNLMAKVGFLYLMFLAGLEVNIKEIINASRRHFIGAMLFIGTMIALGLIIGLWILGMNAVMVTAMPLISIGLLATLSKEYGKNREWIKMAFYVGAIAEVLSITALTVLEVSVATGFQMELLIKILYLLGYLSAILALYYGFRLLFWWFPEFKTKMMPYSDDKDQDFRLAIGIFFMMVMVMEMLHLELAFGAFVAGLFISTFFNHKRELEHKMSSFGFGFLIPIFFIHVGASFDYAVFYDVIYMAVGILVFMIVIRLGASTMLIKLIGVKHSILVAFSLSMPLTLLVATATVGSHYGFIEDIDYYAIILASLLEVIIFMSAIKIIAKWK